MIPGSGRSPGGGHGNPLQYSCLETPQGQRSPATAHGVAESDTTNHSTARKDDLLLPETYAVSNSPVKPSAPGPFFPVENFCLLIQSPYFKSSVQIFHIPS